MTAKRFQDLQVYQLSEKLADDIWKIVGEWDLFDKETIGKQIVRSADSIGANIAEGSGRGSFQDNKRFIKIARGSLNETQHWLRRAYMRNLLSSEQINSIQIILNELAPKLNSYLNSIGNIPKTNDQ
ncbi:MULTISPECIES: four helix bundle protein [unclassified Tolypothrix]|uniref:four helix bundle protein n=1 Tax=unclassified Tolypothrix TaxID=2649714 RepID=UPI0005EAA7A4|nr:MULTISPECIES: four helix bundle protein [unclassified Tolypothrix]BAY88452.1 S23 ribosomal protein [Microchaete diplosiphon NIES-3275]EKF02172.1 ribosomal protein S23 [Tolypothrix sp. PCC 7601]MBE9081133.1 four helix bundle protein [Tolypothrix sp. LEGE 11397]UYD29132.1 four helix bundle protein [Tolypothrix sp. PCC 7712]UYD34955.1 four helix bundle protein [Tolypothrix sp. PCC 7601]